MSMAGETFDLFKPPVPGVLRLHKPLQARDAVLHDDGSASCEGVRVTCTEALRGLCGAMAAAGFTDSSLRLVDEDGASVAIVESIHRSALDAIADTIRVSKILATPAAATVVE